MTASLLLDSNILVYAYDRSEPTKQKQALALLDNVVSAGTGAISTQVLGEMFRVVTRRLPAPLAVEAALDQVEALAHSMLVLDVTWPIVLEAMRGVRDHRFSYWDGQIWAAARLNQIQVVLSEDFAAGAIVDGVRFVNPFSRDFDPTSVGLSEWKAVEPP